MSLYIQRYGGPGKPKLVLLHGWGMNADVWADWANLLAEQFYVICPDIPGLGRSTKTDEVSLGELSRTLVAEIADPAENPLQPAIWLGWSLGGLLAMKAAECFPSHVSAVVTVATTPCFVGQKGWPHAMAPETFSRFQQDVIQQPDKTLQRFCGLMVQGENDARPVLKQFKSLLQQAPSATGLTETLQLLLDDYRPLFTHLQKPCEHWFAENDALVPVATSALLTENSWVIEGAGHAPFLSQPEVCAERLTAFAASLEMADG